MKNIALAIFGNFCRAGSDFPSHDWRPLRALTFAALALLTVPALTVLVGVLAGILWWPLLAVSPALSVLWFTSPPFRHLAQWAAA